MSPPGRSLLLMSTMATTAAMAGRSTTRPMMPNSIGPIDATPWKQPETKGGKHAKSRKSELFRMAPVEDVYQRPYARGSRWVTSAALRSKARHHRCLGTGRIRAHPGSLAPGQAGSGEYRPSIGLMARIGRCSGHGTTPGRAAQSRLEFRLSE